MTGGSRLRFHWRDPHAARAFRTAVSLHSHTSSSREALDFIPRIVRGIPPLRALEALCRHLYKWRRRQPLDYNSIWWTPPLSPIEALTLERKQIESELGLEAFVSLTDHDTIDGVWSLRSLDTSRNALVSVEWTIPQEESFLHLGVHNLPPSQATRAMDWMAGFTARPCEASLPELLDALNSCRETLVVLNHPLWDEKGIGKDRHRSIVARFLSKYGAGIHALELNGLRPWHENEDVTRLALETGLPLISGGDRHGFEPNANVNLTQASTFGEFVEEIRCDRSSDVLFLPQYNRSYTLRVAETVRDVLRSNPAHALGWYGWSDRVFRRDETGAIRPLSGYWRKGGKAPSLSAVSTIRT